MLHVQTILLQAKCVEVNVTAILLLLGKRDVIDFYNRLEVAIMLVLVAVHINGR